ncbi:hypothetical protein I6A86_17890 [Clostridioides difficile]|nr:hypothetical protein [Clostridioides difficile]MBZ0937824.1 hypothetical protein [Clostridioides difficile]
MIKITEEELNSLIDTEEYVIETEIFNEETDCSEIYGEALNEILANVYDISYLDCLKQSFPILEDEDLIEIQEAVIEGLKQRLLEL